MPTSLPPEPAALQRLSVLAASVVGRAVAVQLQLAPARHATHTDGATIFLDALDEQARTKVLLQAALLAAGSVDPACLRRLWGRPVPSARYLALEARRALSVLEDRLPDGLASALFTDEAQPTDSSATSLQHALNSGLKLASLAPGWGVLRPGLILVRGAPHLAYVSATTVQQQGRFATTEVDELDSDDPGEEVAFFKYLANPLSSGGKLADLLKDILGLGASPGSEPEAGAGGDELPVGRQERGRRRGQGVLARFVPALQAWATDGLASPAGLRYPEWDEGQHAYRSDWVTVVEAEPGLGEPGAPGGAARQTGSAGPPVSRAALRRQLTGLGLSFEPAHRQPVGDELALGPLLEHAIDLRRGVEPDGRLYTQPMRTRRDLGVLILVDASGSTAEAGPAGRPIHAEQMAAALALAAELNALGERVSLAAFRSWGREQVQWLQLKGFEERAMGGAGLRATQVQPEGYTRLGAAVRHAGHRLATEAGTPYQLLLLVSDGYAYDQDYEGRYAAADTAQALAELQQRSIATACLSLGSEADGRFLRQVFGAAAHLRGDGLAALLPQLRPCLRAALRQVQRRRVSNGPVRFG